MRCKWLLPLTMIMTLQTKKKNPWLKRILVLALLALLAGAGVVWYIFNDTFADTSHIKADYTVNARDLIREFQQNDSAANRKYSEKIILVRGVVTAVEPADTTVNLKMADTISGAYIIFSFQQQHMAEAKKVKEGDSIVVKGSCSGGVYSEILGSEYISFKRSTISK